MACTAGALSQAILLLITEAKLTLTGIIKAVVEAVVPLLIVKEIITVDIIWEASALGLEEAEVRDLPYKVVLEGVLEGIITTVTARGLVAAVVIILALLTPQVSSTHSLTITQLTPLT